MPRGTTTASLADTIELLMLSREMARDKGDLAEAVLGGRSARQLALVEDALGRMASRRATLPQYPFGRGDAGVLLPADSAESSSYAALLLVSRAGGTSGSISRANEVLDVLAVHALEGLLGRGETEVVDFAWPPRLAASPRPEDFAAAVNWLGARLGISTGHGYRPPQRKDGGVDMVAIRRLAGSPMAAPTVLVQTTVSNDVRHKSRDIDLGLWRTWLDLSPATLVALVVPHELDAAQMDELHASGVVVLDRLRLASLMPELLVSMPTYLSDWLRAELRRQVDREMGR